MKKGTMNTLVIMVLLALVIAAPFLVQGAKPACNDGKDNDNDGLTDYPADPGCVNKGDKDETDIPAPVCGNNIKEAGEVCDGTDLAGQTCTSQGFDGGTLSCKADCSGFDTSSCFTDSCSDTDNGFVTTVKGTVSGENGGTSFSHTDSCSGTVLTEWTCSGTTPTSGTIDCNDVINQTTATCSDGACK